MAHLMEVRCIVEVISELQRARCKVDSGAGCDQKTMICARGAVVYCSWLGKEEEKGAGFVKRGKSKRQ